MTALLLSVFLLGAPGHRADSRVHVSRLPDGSWLTRVKGPGTAKACNWWDRRPAARLFERDEVSGCCLRTEPKGGL